MKYKITDIEALEKAYPKAVITVRTPDRAMVTKLVRAAEVLGQTIPGIEMPKPDVLADIPEGMKGAAKKDDAKKPAPHEFLSA